MEIQSIKEAEQIWQSHNRKEMENNSKDRLHILQHQPEKNSCGPDCKCKSNSELIAELQKQVAALKAQIDKIDARTDHMTVIGGLPF
jgi:polyhydroxyalkanoate synthesis regulator phasin